MRFGRAVATCFRKYVTFSGRAGRSEYWWFVLFVAVCSIASSILDGIVFGIGTDDEPTTELFHTIVSIGTFLPLLAAGWRRMHDSGRSGWYLLLPVLVSIAIFAGLMFGVTGFADKARSGEEAVLLAAESGLGLGVLIVGGLVQIVLTVLVLWWLTRPTEPAANAYGPVPA